MTYTKQAAAERAVENELDGFTTEQIREMRGYVAEVVVWRLIRDGFISDASEVSR